MPYKTTLLSYDASLQLSIQGRKHVCEFLTQRVKEINEGTRCSAKSLSEQQICVKDVVT